MIVAPPPRSPGDSPSLPSSATQPGTETPVVDVATIIGDGREAVILHRGERYRLRLTANDKLILTK